MTQELEQMGCEDASGHGSVRGAASLHASWKIRRDDATLAQPRSRHLRASPATEFSVFFESSHRSKQSLTMQWILPVRTRWLTWYAARPY
eukprot:s864_g9.t1